MIALLSAWLGGYALLALLTFLVGRASPFHRLPPSTYLLLLGWPVFFPISVVLTVVERVRR